MKDDPAAVGSGGEGEAEGEQFSKSHSEGPSASLREWHEERIKWINIRRSNGAISKDGYHLKKLW